MKDFLEDRVNALLFEDNNVDGLLNAYDLLFPLRETLISGGRKTAEKYSWQTIARNLTDIYRELTK